MKYEESIDEEIERIALYIQSLHNRLMDIYFSLEKEDEKKKYRRILRASGDVYRAVVELKPSKKIFLKHYLTF